MAIFFILIGIVIIAAGVVGFLFYLFKQESERSQVKVETSPLAPEMFPPPSTPSAVELEYKQRVEQLEEELKAISEKGAAQANEAMSLIDKLTKENQDLKITPAVNVEMEQKFNEVQKQAEQLQQENFLLSNQLQQAQTQVETLRQESEAIQLRMNDELRSTRLTLESLRSEKESIILNRDSSSQTIQSLNREIDEAKNEIENIQTEIAALRETNDLLRTTNEALTTQSKLTEQELLRQRAQITGLERICENYRIQLEEKVNQ